ncbi:hypothetical protein C0Q44_14890 [Paenibacillus sp. PCH8]|nr:hypothetical protein C0Q44_14890 [Paenibacillus sp. PCH8]
MHEGNLKGFSSKLVFDPASKFGMVVMTNQSYEEIYYYGLIKEIFGDNVNSNIITSEGEDIFNPHDGLPLDLPIYSGSLI